MWNEYIEPICTPDTASAESAHTSARRESGRSDHMLATPVVTTPCDLGRTASDAATALAHAYSFDCDCGGCTREFKRRILARLRGDHGTFGASGIRAQPAHESSKSDGGEGHAAKMTTNEGGAQ